jgi:PEGA domain-containing protein
LTSNIDHFYTETIGFSFVMLSSCLSSLQKRGLPYLLLLGILVPSSFGIDTPWQTARIVEVKTGANTRNEIWIVNTPNQGEETVCTVRVHLQDRIYQGVYTLDKSQPPPRPEWVKHALVRVQITKNRMILKSPAGADYKLRLVSSKPAPMMDPLTSEELAGEKAEIAKEKEASKSLIGFDDREDAAKPAHDVPPPPSTPASAEPVTGVVTIASTPYLAEVYVDGESLGYTPAKLKLPPGKHALRCEKPGYKAWTKEITVAAGSEQTLDATLEHK